MATWGVGPRSSGKNEFARELAGHDYVLFSDDIFERDRHPLTEEEVDRLDLVYDKTGLGPVIFEFEYTPQVERQHNLLLKLRTEITMNRRLIILVSDHVFPEVLWGLVRDIYVSYPLWLLNLAVQPSNEQQTCFWQRFCREVNMSESVLLREVAKNSAQGAWMLKLKRQPQRETLITHVCPKDRRDIWSSLLNQFKADQLVEPDDLAKVEDELKRLGVCPSEIRFNTLKEIFLSI